MSYTFLVIIFKNHVFKRSNKKNVAKVPYLKVHGFMTVDIENKLLCYGSYLHKTRIYTMNW